MVVLDWATQLDLYNKGKFQLMSNGYSARLDPSLSFDMVSGDKDLQPRKIWDNRAALGLLVESMQVGGVAARQKIFDDMERMWREDLPMIGFFSTAQISVARSNVVGYKNWALAQPRAWGGEASLGRTRVAVLTRQGDHHGLLDQFREPGADRSFAFAEILGLAGFIENHAQIATWHQDSSVYGFS